MLSAILNRLHFRFSLRTLLIAVAICGATCGWIAVQRRWVRDRQEIAATYRWSKVYGRNKQPMPPWPLGFFGEQGCATIWLSEEITDQELDRIKKLFPEARVSRWYVREVDSRWPKSRD
jgi:hypothetical protein